jgi:hypothetical protein
MPERKLIHVNDDLMSVCKFANSLGMIVVPDKSNNAPTIVQLDPNKALSFERGVYLLLRDEWIFSEPKFSYIKTGAFAGFRWEHINMISIQLYVHGESRLNGVRRLGSGTLSFRSSWLDADAKVIRDTPPEVRKAYRAITKHFLSNNFIKAGVERFNLTRLAIEAIATEITLPPFDYITWPPELKTKTPHSG